MARALVSIAKAWTRNIPAFALLAVWLFVQGATLYSPKTEVGKQCPTAPVQKVLTAIKTCCNTVVGYKWESPKLGDKSFVQCQCAEKKVAETSLSSAPVMAVLCPEQFRLSIPPSLPFTNPHPPYLCAYISRTSPPEIRPPSPA